MSVLDELGSGCLDFNDLIVTIQLNRVSKNNLKFKTKMPKAIKKEKADYFDGHVTYAHKRDAENALARYMITKGIKSKDFKTKKLKLG